jgi:peptidoglycan/xylan/chitin deacetylase (PgdA/CDA1 family)
MGIKFTRRDIIKGGICALGIAAVNPEVALCGPSRNQTRTNVTESGSTKASLVEPLIKPYQDVLINGASLPEMTLCLTFDDGPGETSTPGPGPRTVELAQYLNGQGIPATFFMVGKFASDLPDILPQVKSLGHLIGNHSYDHPSLIEYSQNGGDVVSQIARTDGLIRHWVDAPVVFVRPPYFAWNTEVASALNANLTASLSHVGPVGWDIDGSDWTCWRDKRIPEECAANYIQQVETQRRGIVIMHDCTADMDVVRLANRTFEMVQLLVPQLRERGYQFVRLDAVPGVAASNQNAIRLALRGFNGLYVSPQHGGGGAIIVNGPAVGPWEPLVVEDLSVGKVALSATTGQYISPQNGGGGDVLADGPAVGLWEPLDLISFGNNQVAFRTITGHFLTCDTSAGGALKATSSSNQPPTVFTYEYLPSVAPANEG